MFTVEIDSLKVEDYVTLSQSVGWGANRKYDMDKLSAAIKATAFTVSVSNAEGRVVGCGRAFSDDVIMTFIPDIFVHPEFQKQGIGKMIMDKIIERYGHTLFYFGAQPGKETFYEKLGFKKGIQSFTGTFKKNPYFS